VLLSGLFTYAAGELDELEDFVRNLNWKMNLSLFDVVFPTCGLLDGNKIYELLTEHLQELCIEEAGIPFLLCRNRFDHRQRGAVAFWKNG